VVIFIAFMVGFLWHYLQVFLDLHITPKKKEEEKK
jgi:hypothetical protein